MINKLPVIIIGGEHFGKGGFLVDIFPLCQFQPVSIYGDVYMIENIFIKGVLINAKTTM